ncbi:hypothetical protein QUC31_002373 [Theobroma cacao]
MVKRLLPRHLRFSRQPLYGFFLHLQNLSGRKRPEVGTRGKGISNVEEKDKRLELVNKGGNQFVRNEMISEVAAFELPGIPLALSKQDRKSSVTFVLEQTSLLCANVGRVLCRITDSLLCKSGRIQAIYVKTNEGVLTTVEPNTHIPRTPQRFRNMMAELLQKFSVKAANKHGKLLRLVENPVT